MAQFGNMLNQARQLSGKIGDMQQRLADLRIPGRSLDGRVLVELTGQGQMVRCEIAPDLLSPSAAPALERDVIEATNAAHAQVREAALKVMGDAAGGLDLSSLKGMLPGFGAG
ncbi:MAG: YbaB/EbfC family nucleoid-associated protein [Planctomycetaceae bacterium]|nr:YbaB/EbfC family nucleoid-associated protein [Planctomycetaceae bacterium]